MLRAKNKSASFLAQQCIQLDIDGSNDETIQQSEQGQ